jgi:hypothetical protein
MSYHLELTFRASAPVTPSPSHEDLLVFYIPDASLWRQACERMLAAGFQCVAALNPYWSRHGRTFEDPDGYRTVLQNAAWPSAGIGQAGP